MKPGCAWVITDVPLKLMVPNGMGEGENCFEQVQLGFLCTVLLKPQCFHTLHGFVATRLDWIT